MNKDSGNNKGLHGSSEKERCSHRLRQRLKPGVREVESNSLRGKKDTGEVAGDER